MGAPLFESILHGLDKGPPIIHDLKNCKQMSNDCGATFSDFQDCRL